MKVIITRQQKRIHSFINVYTCMHVYFCSTYLFILITQCYLRGTVIGLILTIQTPARSPSILILKWDCTIYVSKRTCRSLRNRRKISFCPNTVGTIYDLRLNSSFVCNSRIIPSVTLVIFMRTFFFTKSHLFQLIWHV